jgi:hypothetical protein
LEIPDTTILPLEAVVTGTYVGKMVPCETAAEAGVILPLSKRIAASAESTLAPAESRFTLIEKLQPLLKVPVAGVSVKLAAEALMGVASINKMIIKLIIFNII